MIVVYFTLYATIAIISLLYFYIKARHAYWSKRNIPHDKPEFLIGSLRRFAKNGMHSMFTDIYREHRGSVPFFGFFNLLRPSVVVLDLDLIKNILIKDFNAFDDRGLYYNEKVDPISAHLFALDGDKWKPLRGKLSPTFSSGKMKFMFPIMLGVGEEFLRVLEKQIEEVSPDVDIKDMLARFTTDIIGRCAFGIECNSLKDPNVEFRRRGQKSFSFNQFRFTLLFVEALPKLAKFLNFRRISKESSDFYTKIVNETIAYREKNNVRRNDFMDLLLDLKNQKSIQIEKGEEVAALTINEIVAQSFVFFLAGFETSSTTMSFALYALSQNLALQEKLRSEVNEVIEKHNGEITYEALNEMAYLDQVISETLRIYSPVSFLRRRAKVNYVTENTKFVIPKDAYVMLPIREIHLDPKIYPNPEVFDPERFASEELKKRHPMSWLPFGDGPRNCIGLRFGQMQTRLGLAMVIKNFRFYATNNTPIPMRFNKNLPVLSSEKEIILKVEKIQ